MQILGGAAAYDLNGDGVSDVVLAEGRSITVLVSQPNHSFNSSTYSSAGSAVAVPIFGDFNGDGKTDVAISESGAGLGGVDVLLGNGDGTFQPTSFTSLPVTQTPSIVFDLTGDGKLDILVPSLLQTPGFQILYGNGDGTFQAPVVYPTEHPVTTVAAGDLNLDGLMDVITTDGNTVTTIHGIGKRKFGAGQNLLAGDTPSTPVVIDVNGDGAPDLIFANSETNGASTVTVLLNFGVTTGSLNISPSPAEYGEPLILTAALKATVPAAGFPSGTVNFSIDNSPLDAATFQSGSASVTGKNILALGSHTVTAMAR